MKNKLTKFRFMTIIKIQNKISHEIKVKKINFVLKEGEQ